MKKKLPSLSASEQGIMHWLWRLAPVGLNALLEAVNGDREEPIARATLQTQLTRLEEKGWVKRNDEGRAHVYEPTVKEQQGRKRVLAELKERLFGGSGMELVRCLVEDGEISSKELKELRALVEKRADEEKGGHA